MSFGLCQIDFVVLRYNLRFGQDNFTVTIFTYELKKSVLFNSKHIIISKEVFLLKTTIFFAK